ncbi:hypothetical protein MRX96_054481 [Rhipicephalus microplus]
MTPEGQRCPDATSQGPEHTGYEPSRRLTARKPKVGEPQCPGGTRHRVRASLPNCNITVGGCHSLLQLWFESMPTFQSFMTLHDLFLEDRKDVGFLFYSNMKLITVIMYTLNLS